MLLLGGSSFLLWTLLLWFAFLCWSGFLYDLLVVLSLGHLNLLPINLLMQDSEEV